MDEQNIPIDINTNKLLDWLISRRHVNKEWHTNIIKVREKINNAIQDMPVHEGIIKLLSGQHINYFHCLKIVDILKETEADTKNLFGRYGSQRMKDWQDILQSYQKENLYLAESAQILMRNVSYEVPSLKKQVAKLEQTQSEFNSSCKQLGIEGKKIKKELVNMLDELPEIYKKAAETIAMVKPALELYSAFINFHSDQRKDEVLPLLKYLIKNGNTTTYEYTYGEKPVSIDEPLLKIEIDDSDEDKNSEEIDFGDDIDFGDVNTESNIDFAITPMSEGDIDWGTLNTIEDDFEIVDHVDLDINLEESGIVVEKSGLDGGIAKGNDAYSLLDNPSTQNLILNDLMELKAFLNMRLYEMSGDSDLLSMSQIDAPTLLQMQTVESLTSMNDCVTVSLNELLNKRTQHLHNVKHSARYVDILAASLKQKLNAVQRIKDSKQIVEEKIGEAQLEIKKLQPTISTVIGNTKVLQKNIEDDISKKYKGRPVNIVGGVNMM
ncbi:cdk5 regulatory subunit-associated protein 3 [Holotrichia oblita]|uniref:Cdk5 regulatory subunit-associated protein 3 n=1 Tax=Holotrichia oblita TaxID=644536 RepID=A0ACB9TXT2_HOLOL|nr:cdk5 regulatory subunit-associated protein 3 [Holotrichia oblita]